MEANEESRKHSRNEGEEVIQANEDMISQLSEPIQLHILSFMSIKDAGRTSVLSKTWQKVWKSLPVVDLIKFLFPPEKFSFEESEESFTNFCESLSTLCKHKSIVQCFEICVPSSACYVTERLDGCIDLVMRNCVKAFSIQIRSSLSDPLYEDRVMYTLPQSVFATRSLTCLKLIECKLGDELFVSNTLFPHMRVLYLEDVCLEEENLQKLLSICPLLEEFTLACNPLFSCNPFNKVTSIHLFNLSRLQKVKLIDIDKIRIDLPTLETLEIFIGLGLPADVEITNCSNLKVFNLHAPMRLKPRLEELLSKCPQLETLSLSISHSPCFKISSKSLRTLHLHDLSKVERVVIDAPNLHSYKYMVHGMSIALHSINSTSLKEFMIELNLIKLDLSCLYYLSTILAIFSQQQVEVGLTISWAGLLPMQLEKCPVPPTSCINSLKLIYTSSDDFTLVMDKVLLICHPIKLQVIAQDERCKQNLKVFWEKLIQRNENPKCCGDHCTFTCWQRHLKGANLVVMAEDLESHDENVFPPLLSQSFTEFRLEWH
ncbi:hypothetical protein L6164_017443 [Bauhinia variegata]|uniref:Uncharacterized protein n=1 Tax=Bauhinia variegata TaxID=167791 RepID=A0ACB9N845_BAUVA|nr:hypothetical protein L6164_017443 [Bauhinia variegata]